ncbi:MAG TPA: enoyl-[acyl-carrier-protein] reductase FabK [Thermosulfidibacter takaii]|uniref:Enoyl-[acyl-carrier-protein] reductase FabK n=1 Tax=Thermosulfidibacter takaii TaxID=412593 RepID=A0A7C0Y912_9BACT|nr:enoyl-[acyl-carrier-protein] reductase FabK [Thermosulfidibacter takaii]
MFKTELCDLLGVEYPIIQGGMAWVSDAYLAVAVSEAGALGVIAAGHIQDPEDLRREIRTVKELTSRPFGVNIMLMNPLASQLVELVLEEGVPVVTTGAGNPGKFISCLREAGVKVVPVVASVALAKRVEREGAHAVVVEGTEAGGHIGELTTMALVPQVVDAVSIPVVAAGGIADGRGFLAALALGAHGVQMGTRFAASTECRVHENWKRAYLRARDRDTVVTGRSTGHPVRVIRNRLAREFLKLEQGGASMEEFDMLGVGALRRAALEGDVEMGSVMAGQIVGLIKEIKPVKEIIGEIMAQARRELERLQSLMGG